MELRCKIDRCTCSAGILQQHQDNLSGVVLSIATRYPLTGEELATTAKRFSPMEPARDRRIGATRGRRISAS
jgi:hypothetical protein